MLVLCPSQRELADKGLRAEPQPSIPLFPAILLRTENMFLVVLV